MTITKESIKLKTNTSRLLLRPVRLGNSPNVPQTTTRQEPAVRKAPQASSQGEWYYEIQNGTSCWKIGGTNGKIPEKVVNTFMFNQIVSGLKALMEAVRLFKELFFPNK